MNVPGQAGGNWRWRLTDDMLSPAAFDWLRDLTKASNRSRVGSAVADRPRSRNRGDTMKATQILHNLGPEHLARQYYARLAGQRHVEALYRRMSSRDSRRIRHFRSRHQEQLCYDTRSATICEMEKPGRGFSLSSPWTTSREAAQHFRPIYDQTNGVTDGYRWKYRRCWPTTPRARSALPRFAYPRSAPNLFIKYQARTRACPPRGGDLRRNTGERDAPVLARAVSCGREAFLRGVERRIGAGLIPMSTRSHPSS